MKKPLIFAASLSCALTLAFCKSSKKTTAIAELSGEEKLVRQMKVAETRWPGVAAAELQEGHRIYTTKCTKCHGNFEITSFSEGKWKHEIDEMAPKAKLTASEKEQLTRHLLSYREAFAVNSAH